MMLRLMEIDGVIINAEKIVLMKSATCNSQWDTERPLEGTDIYLEGVVDPIRVKPSVVQILEILNRLMKD